MQIVQVVQLFRYSNKIREHFRALLRCGPRQDLLYRPEAYLNKTLLDLVSSRKTTHVIKTPSERHHVRRHHQLILLVPGATGKLIRLDAEKNRQIQHGELTGKVIGRYSEYIENGTAVVFAALSAAGTG